MGCAHRSEVVAKIRRVYLSMSFQLPKYAQLVHFQLDFYAANRENLNNKTFYHSIKSPSIVHRKGH